MKPEEKAKDLVDKFKHQHVKGKFFTDDFNPEREKRLDDEAKACAIICVNEILNTLKKILGSGEFTTEYEKKKIEYYQSVKTHIQNL